MQSTEKVTLTLPVDLMAAVRTLSPARRHSQFIAEAIRVYIAEQQRRTLRDRLMAGYQANADADAVLTAEWEVVENETWLNQTPMVDEKE